jgi:hypothetical protein
MVVFDRAKLAGGERGKLGRRWRLLIPAIRAGHRAHVSNRRHRCGWRDSLAIRAGHRAHVRNRRHRCGSRDSPAINSLATGDTDVDRGTHALSVQAIGHSLATGDTDVDRETHSLSAGDRLTHGWQDMIWTPSGRISPRLAGYDLDGLTLGCVDMISTGWLGARHGHSKCL